MPLSNASIVTAVKDHVSCDLDGEAVILNVTSGVYYGLNAVGARIWALLQEKPRSIEQLRQVLLDEYDVDAERSEAQLFALLDELESKGLITSGE